MSGGAWICPACRRIHSAEHTLVDTFCPWCGESRDSQRLITCSVCGDPVRPGGPRWIHSVNPGRDHEAMPGPIVGMRVLSPEGSPVGTVVRVFPSSCVVQVNGEQRTVRYNLGEDGVFRRSGSIRHMLIDATKTDTEGDAK